MSRLWDIIVRFAGKIAGRKAAPTPTPPTTARADPPADPPATPTAPDPPAHLLVTPPAPPAPSSVPTILLALLNRERGMVRVPRCDLDGRLTAAAEGHADAMADAERCEHAVSYGPAAEDRVLAAGYAFCRLREAVAAGQNTALEVLKDWLAHPESQAALLDPRCRHAGFGLSVAHDGRHYWVAILASPQAGGAEPDARSSVRLAAPVVRRSPKP